MSSQTHVAFNQSSVSGLWKLMTKLCMIPIKLNPSEGTATFKLRSKQTLIFMLFQSIMIGGSTAMFIYFAGIETLVIWFKALVKESNTVDVISFLVITFISTQIPNYNLFFSKEITHLGSEIILSQNLQLPNHWKKFVFVSVLYTCSSLVMSIIKQRYSTVDLGELCLAVWLFLLINVCSNQFGLCFIILTFLDEYKRIILLPTTKIIMHTSKSINLFESLQKGFGTTFLVVFSFSQIQNIFCAYMSISSMMSNNGNAGQNIILSLCFFVWSVYCMTLLYCITLTAEDAYDALQSLHTPLEKMLVNENDISRKEYIRATMRKLEKTCPLNGNGYFTLSRETLTSTVSTTVTYLIILVQFRKA